MRLLVALENSFLEFRMYFLQSVESVQLFAISSLLGLWSMFVLVSEEMFEQKRTDFGYVEIE